MVSTQVMLHQQVPQRSPLRPSSRRLEAYRPRRDSFQMLQREAEFEKVMVPHKVGVAGATMATALSLL